MPTSDSVHDPLAPDTVQITQSFADSASSSPDAPEDDVPVTVLVSRRIRHGREVEFESRLCELAEVLAEHPGFTDMKAYPPGTPDDEHKVVLCFKSAHDLASWQSSPARSQWLEGVKPLEASAPHAQILTGIESWFTLPSQPGIHPPPRHKMALVTWMGIFPLITLVNILLAPRLDWMPPVVRSALLSAMMVTLMTYIVMPRVTRFCARFLYPEIELPQRRKSDRRQSKAAP